MKRKYLGLILILILVVGCKNMKDTPTSHVENFMSKYQKLDSEVLNQLDMIVANRLDLTDSQKEKYRNLMERQYQDMTYKIKDEVSDDNHATVTISVLVYDYQSAINKSEEHYNKNKEEFQKEDGSIDIEKYWDYKISEMTKVEDKKENEIVFTLHKDKNKWVLDDVSDSDREKLHGVYNG